MTGRLQKVFRCLGIGILFTLCCIGAAGCGKQEENEGVQDIWTESQKVSNGAEEVDTSGMIEYAHLGSQFWNAEQVQLWGERRLNGCDVYLHREDSSRELLAKGVEGKYLGAGKWWLDGEKNCYILDANGILRMDGDGNEIFNKKVDGYVKNMCQLEDGRLIVLVFGNQKDGLFELDPDSGSLKELQGIQLKGITGINMVAAEGGRVFLLANEGAWELDLTDGTLDNLISFVGTSYALVRDGASHGRDKEDFRMLEDGSIELLWNDGTVETVKMEEVDAGKTMLTLRSFIMSSWMKEQVVKFNQQSTDYYINIEETREADNKQFVEKTLLELGTGKGADIICSDAVDEAYSLIEKGAFADMSPYMEASGMREEDYFPAAFSGWKYGNGFYGASFLSMPESLWIRQEVAGESGISDMEALLDRLLAYQGDAVFLKYYDKASLLELFLKDSESLCGMVDLEAGTCSLDGELFGKLLETAERYGYDDTKAACEAVAGKLYYDNFYTFLDSGHLSEAGKVSLGYWFDDGWHAELKNDILAINNNSANKEGAWEFISFLLSEGTQSGFQVDDGNLSGMLYFPVDRDVYEALCGKHADVINGGHDVKIVSDDEVINCSTGLTKERKEELSEVLEGARTAPFCLEPLLKIILEEAGAYFTGTKGIDEVRDMAQNRIQLYLDERK